NLGRGAPLDVGEQAGAVRRDLVSLVEPANEIGAPAQQPDGVIPAERQPVERIGVAAGVVRRVHEFPVAVTVAVLCPPQGFYRACGYLSHIHSGALVMISAITVLMAFWPSSSTIRS